MTFYSWLFAIYFFASSAVLVCFAAVICLFNAPFDRNRKLLHRFASAWGYHYLLVFPGWQVHFEGKEHIDPHKAYVLISNHQSYFDILALYGLFRPYKWVSKQEVFKIPFVGWNMRLNQYVNIARGNLSSIKKMWQDCRYWLNQGDSVMIFPEGTRSETGQIGPFTNGAFKLAVDTGLPLVPIVIEGTYDIYPKGSKNVKYGGRITVKIMEPLLAADFDNDPRKMKEYVHDLMVRTLAELKQQKALALTVH